MVIWLCLLMASLVGQEELKEIQAEDAGKHMGQKVEVVLTVAGSSFLKDRDLCFLNSKKNHRDEDNFSVVFRKEGLKAFAEKKIEDPAKHFRNKKVKVTGKIEEYNGKPQIIITKFEQIKTLAVVVEKETPPSEDENQNIRKF